MLFRSVYSSFQPSEKKFHRVRSGGGAFSSCDGQMSCSSCGRSAGGCAPFGGAINSGAAAGASLEHSHSQLIVTPIVPINVLEEMNGALEFYGYRGRCIFCDIVHQELGAEKRIVLDTPNFLAFCPFASRFPFETWVLPKHHNSHFENIQKNEVEELGTVFKTILLKLETALDKPSYNYIIHTSPFDTQNLPHFHWHIEIIPRLTRVAGFEWGTGFYINPVPPEQAATYLKQTEVDLTARPKR